MSFYIQLESMTYCTCANNRNRARAETSTTGLQGCGISIFSSHSLQHPEIREIPLRVSRKFGLSSGSNLSSRPTASSTLLGLVRWVKPSERKKYQLIICSPKKTRQTPFPFSPKSLGRKRQKEKTKPFPKHSVDIYKTKRTHKGYSLNSLYKGLRFRV